MNTAYQSVRRARSRGFTLIEVMITVAIVAVLAGIAMPQYFEYVRRGQLPEAQAALSDFRVKMEQYFQDNRSYGSAPKCNDTNTPSWSDGNSTLTYNGAKYFDYSCRTTSSVAYVITATGKAGTRASGYVYTVNESNQRQTTQFAGAAVAKNCWAIKSSDC